MKQVLLFSLVIMFFFNCNSKKKVFGTYISKKENLAKHELVLNMDSTFQYTIKGDLIDQFSYGRWHEKLNSIILESDPSLRIGEIDRVEIHEPLTSDFKIRVVNEEGDPLSFASIVVNNDSNKPMLLNSEGFTNFKSNVSSINIYYLGEVYTVNPPSSDSINSLKIRIRLTSNESFSLIGDIWKRNGSSLLNKNGTILSKLIRVN